ncbi:Ankyrin repeat domain-containing protein 27 [Penaeus vannamei]|uniref:Ankyrin repeat domain-containing protein 27 n=1 Tax=Penaeus vannamei TaxID=6689 RepID=A0A3R7LY40_PENVA|nr:acyl-CoA-binding domain-containing protein 6-like [Penaeus vannamei]ROT66290.1 Ankyrin repeat domain-containing protein 27 [Penaeus vannamei]
MVQDLLKAGAAPNVTDLAGNSALAWAAFNGNHVIIEDLLNTGARINITNNHGNTPLVLASKMKHLDIVKLLLERGAAVTQQDNLGKNCNTVGNLLARASRQLIAHVWTRCCQLRV